MILPYISVVVATYRGIAALQNALISPAGQIYRNFEIIVVDDNGNEELNLQVKNIVEHFRNAYLTISLKYVMNLFNMGSVKTRNIGIENSVGKYVTSLDDDIYLPDKIETQIKGMLNANVDYSFTDLHLCNEKGKLIDRRIRNYLSDYNWQSLLEYHLNYHMTGTDTFMFKREYLLLVACFGSINVGDEFYLIQKAIQGGGKLYYQPECHVKAYVHTGEGRLSSGQGKIDGENQLYVFKKQFFTKISWKSRRYIRMRHYVVLAFAGLRMRNLLWAFKYGLVSSACTPIQCIKMCLERKL